MATAERAFVVHVYETATARGDDPFATVAVSVFESMDAAASALEAAGWVAYPNEPTAWRAPVGRRRAEIHADRGLPPAG